MWFDPGLAGLFITSTLLHLEEDINLLVVSKTIVKKGGFDIHLIDSPSILGNNDHY